MVCSGRAALGFLHPKSKRPISLPRVLARVCPAPLVPHGRSREPIFCPRCAAGMVNRPHAGRGRRHRGTVLHRVSRQGCAAEFAGSMATGPARLPISLAVPRTVDAPGARVTRELHSPCPELRSRFACDDRFPVAQRPRSNSGWRSTPAASQARIAGGKCTSAASACACDANSAKTQLPEPLMRAGANDPSWAR